MQEIWHWVLYVLAVSASDPQLLEHERARTAGSVNVAYASLAVEPPPAPEPKPKPAPAAACKQCGGTGKIFRPDGGYVRCGCGACPAGTCPKVLR